MRQAEQKVSDPKEEEFLKNLNSYGMVTLRDPHNWNDNVATKLTWTTKNREVKSCDWKVSYSNEM